MAAKSFTVDVTPAVLRWARESAGYTVADVKERLKDLAESDVEAWESGREQPTWSELRKLAHFYRRPVASLLLDEPPQDAPPPTDFRTLPDAEKVLSPPTRFVIRTARWLVRKAAELEGELGIAEPPELPAFRLSADPEQVAQDLRDSLGVSIKDQIGWRSAGEALRRWRAAIEARYAFVFQFRMPIQEVLGFSLVEEGHPVIVLNRADFINRRIFTLFHEFAHLVVDQPGICVPNEHINDESHRAETFCNRFANAFLVPRADLKANLPDAPRDAAIARLANRYRVSRYVVLSAMLAVGAVSKEIYQYTLRRWQRGEERPPTPSKQKGGLTRVGRCLTQRGRRFVSVVLEAERRDQIPAIDATGYLGVKLEDLRTLGLKVK